LRTPESTSDLLVIQPLRDFTCASCGDHDDLLIMDGADAICMACADLDHLVFLPSGDAALTRRAKKLSTLSAVVVRFSRSRQRYERRGLLVEPGALEQAEEQCLSDSDVRARRREREADRRAAEDVRFTNELFAQICRLFPGCPAARARRIAAHTAARGSGRVGRTAAGRAFEERAVTAAVVAAVRHEDTDYDELLMSGMARPDARDAVRSRVDSVLDRWRS
jgi:hypothetical protein